MSDIAELVIDEPIVVVSGGGEGVAIGAGEAQGIASTGNTDNGVAKAPDGLPTILVMPAEDALSAKVLVIEKTAQHAYSALRLVYLVDANTFAYGDPDTYASSKVIGMTLSAGAAGSVAKILTFGQYTDAYFVFTVNEPLFLGLNGVVTDTPPISVYNTTIGNSLGGGSVFIKIGEPIKN